MYGAILGDLVGFPYEYTRADLTDKSIPLLKETKRADSEKAPGPEQAGEIFSDKTVLLTAVQDGLLRLERTMPQSLSDDGSSRVFEQTAMAQIAASMRLFGTSFPLAGFAMDMSIWLHSEGAEPSGAEDAGPAARVGPVAWMFQDDLYRMRHMARLQAALTHKNKEAVKAADAAASAVFLAAHGCTKDSVADYLEKYFGYRRTTFSAMQEEILRADLSGAGPGRDGADAAGGGGASYCVRAALTAFLYGKDFEDVLRRSVALCGSRMDTAAVAAIAGSIAEAFFGVPSELREECRRRIPAQLLGAADAFSLRMEEKKQLRQRDASARARWESALVRASDRHPAAVQGNEPLEEAISVMNEKRDRQSLLLVLEAVAARIKAQGRLLVPVTSIRRLEKGKEESAAELRLPAAGTPSAVDELPAGDRPDPLPAAGKEGAEGAGQRMAYRLQAVRTKDGRLWQPAFTSREQMKLAGAGDSMALSYPVEALLRRFMEPQGTGEASGQEPAKTRIAGIVLNPAGRPFFLPVQTIEAVFALSRNTRDSSRT